MNARGKFGEVNCLVTAQLLVENRSETGSWQVSWNVWMRRTDRIAWCCGVYRSLSCRELRPKSRSMNTLGSSHNLNSRFHFFFIDKVEY